MQYIYIKKRHRNILLDYLYIVMMYSIVINLFNLFNLFNCVTGNSMVIMFLKL